MIQVTEHETESAAGLPAGMPAGERILWQGRPHLPRLARQVFHTTKVGVYFLILALWQCVSLSYDGYPAAQVIAGTAWPLLIGALAVAILYGLAWANQRATTYTITNRRVIMRFGVALPITLNLPFAQIAAVSVRQFRHDQADISLSMAQGEGLAWAVLWPHARPWRLRSPEPMLRCIANAEKTAAILQDSLQTSEHLPGGQRLTGKHADPAPQRGLAFERGL